MFLCIYIIYIKFPPTPQKLVISLLQNTNQNVLETCLVIWFNILRETEVQKLFSCSETETETDTAYKRLTHIIMHLKEKNGQEEYVRSITKCLRENKINVNFYTEIELCVH